MNKTSNDIHTLSHTTWNCKYHIVFAPKYRRKVFYGDKRLEIGQNTAGKNDKAIEAYIKNQLKEDELSEQLTVDIEDPFTGKKQ